MVRLAVPLLLSSIALGCGPSSATPVAAPAQVAQVVRYGPLAFAADARAPGSGVVLGSDDGGGSTKLPLVAAARAATIAGAPAGTIDLATAPVAGGGRVIASSGRDAAAWRAAAWQAALAAAAALGKEPGDIGFTASARGAANATASSGALAAGFLASRLGARPDPAVVVAGAVCPDGTLAPMPGKRPRPPRDVAGAYRALTGAPLPRAVPVAEADMTVGGGVAAYTASYAAWQSRLAPHWAYALAVDATGGRPAALIALARTARDAGRDAEALRGSEAWPAADDRIAEAWVLAQAAALTGDALDHVAAGNLAAARSRLDTIDAVLALVDAAPAPAGAPTTLGGALAELEAGQRGIAARALARRARERLVAARGALDRLAQRPAAQLGSHDVADEVVAAVAPAVLAAGGAAREALRVPTPRSGDLRYAPDAAALRRRGQTLRSAAGALLAYIDTAREPVTTVARAAAERDDLAAAELATFEAWLAVLDRDVLGLRRDPVTGLVTGADHPDALRALLAAADDTARGHARAARIATGSIPPAARAAYQVARARRGGVAEQRAALEGFWRASMWSQLAIALARNAAPSGTLRP